MYKIELFLAISVALAVSVYAFGSSEERFIKKYAMMKIYESCFGPEVVKQIRQEMKDACVKCAVTEPSAPPTPPPLIHFQGSNINHPGESTKDDTFQADQDNTIRPNFDPEKLHQAILAYRPSPLQQLGLRPFPAAGYYGFASPGPLFYASNSPQFQNAPVPFSSAYTPFPFYAQQFYRNQRMSRDMDLKTQLEALTSRMTGRVRNITCVMQELGYLDDKLEPNYAKIQERIGNLPVPEELRKDMKNGVTFCQQFSQCVPEIKKDKSPLSKELIKPLFFFRCYKHKKLEACVMKDVRERFSGTSEDELDSISADFDLNRSGKAAKIEDNEIDELASSMYEFLYGTDSMDFDTIL